MYYPWVSIPSGSGTTLTVPPEGYVAAVRSKMHNRIGSWQPFAGINSEAGFATGVATGMGRTQAQTLDDSRVNAIRIIAGTVRIYGARSHSLNTTQWRFITHRDTVNYVVEECQVALEPLVFSTINGRKTIYGDIATALKSVLEPIRIAGGLYEGFDSFGRQTDYGYTIRVDDGINPVSQLESGLVRAQVGVRISSIGDKIEVTVTKSNLTATLV
jgi:phage tail sheath protein FI